MSRRLAVVLAIVLGAIAFLVVQGLGNATTFFRNADEAVRDRAELGNSRFRIEGTVVAGSNRPISGKGTAFTIAANGVSVPVIHHGDEPPLFKEMLVPPPVVLEGRFQGDTFASDRIIVKHTESYTEQHPERVTPSTTAVPR